MEPKNLEIVCPGCQGALTVDPESGAVLMHRPPAKTGPKGDLLEAARALKDEAGRREEAFRKSLEAEKNKGGTLKKKFDEALRRARENPDEAPPPREIDLD
jgi:hypothetical protein